MSNRRTIFDIYRSKDFSGKPAGDVWNRIEKKLDEKPIHRRLYFWNKFSVAATFLLLIGIAGTAAWLLHNHKTHPQFASLFSPAQMVEEFEYLDDYRSFAAESAILQEYRNAFNDIYKALQPENAAYAEADTGTDEPDASEEMLTVPSNQPLAFSKRSLYGKPAATPNQKALPTASLQGDFGWLQGSWKGDFEGKPYLTDWFMADSQTMVGKGYVLEEDDTLYKEAITLKQIGGRVYLFQTFAQADQQPIEYEMTLASADSGWIFSHRNERLLLEKESPVSYQMQYLNLGGNARGEKELLKHTMEKRK